MQARGLQIKGDDRGYGIRPVGIGLEKRALGDNLPGTVAEIG